MCGRYALAMRPSQIRQMLEDDGLEVDDAPHDDGGGAPRNSYNFAPGYHGVVYRANTPDQGAGSQDKHQESQKADAQSSSRAEEHAQYKLQSMKWGLIPFWTKRNPDYGSMLKTINCRDDSLSSPGGLWASMKARKRCIVIAQGFYEWLKNGKEKLPHYVKRKDGRLMMFAGLWDCVQYEGSEEKLYTYTIITTDSNSQLKFLHNRMPVLLDPQSSAVTTWLDPTRNEWSKELQALLKPFEGELEVYPVSKDVGKVGNNSPTFIIPLDSKENKSNIVNFFANAKEQKKESTKHGTKNNMEEGDTEKIKKEGSDSIHDLDQSLHPDASPTTKRKASEVLNPEETIQSLAKQQEPRKISATQNKKRSNKKAE
ncbi:hypothetical protein FSARC_14740, partial [Fusarium sarcochroum]